MKYSFLVRKQFDLIFDYPRLTMSTKFTSLERLVARVGVSTVIIDGKFVVAKPSDIERGIDHVTDLAYRGEAALFGEEDTACKAYAYCLEDYFKPMYKGRVLVIKGDECEDDDTSFADCEAYREREAEKTILEKRPPTNFSVDLKGLKRTLQSGNWPKTRVDSSPTGEYCFLLVHPSPRDPKEVRETYINGCEALKQFDPESYREDRYFAWSARYRGAASGFCPPLDCGDKGYFFTHLRKHLLPALKGSKKTDYEVSKTVALVESEDEFEDAVQALDPVSGPPGPGFIGFSETKTGKIVRDYLPGSDPVSQRLTSLGYKGKSKQHYYNLVREGTLSLDRIPAARGEKPKEAPLRQASPSKRFPVSPRDKTHVVFPEYNMTKKLNKISAGGNMDKLTSALVSPHADWTRIPMKVTSQVGSIKAWVERNPHGPLQNLVDKVADLCPTEHSFVKLLSIIASVFDIDCYNSTYSMKVVKHALDSSDEESD